MAKVNEELADMRTSVAWLFEELKGLKNASTSKQKIEAELAFEQRERRRAAKRQSSLNPDSAEFYPGDRVGTDTPVYNSHFPSLSADSPQTGHPVPASVPDPFQ